MKQITWILVAFYILSGIGFATTDYVYVVVGQGEKSYVVDDTGHPVNFDTLKELLKGSFYFENTIFPEMRMVKKRMNGIEVESMSYVFGIKDYKENILAVAVNDKILEKDWGYTLVNGQRIIEMDKSGAVLKEITLDLPEDARIVDVQQDVFIYEEKNGAQGRINQQGQLLERAKASTITYLDASVVHYRVNYGLLDPEKTGIYGVMIKDSQNGQELVALAPGVMGHKVGENLYVGRKPSGQWYFIDYNGFVMTERPVKAMTYINIGKEAEGLIPFAVRSEGGAYQWGYMNREEEVLIKPMFTRASNFKNSFAVVDVGGKKGLINRSGQYMILPELDKITPVQSKGVDYYKVQLGDYSGLMNTDFTWLVKPNKYTYVNLSEEGIYIVKKYGQLYQMGLLDYYGRQIISCDYSSISKLDSHKFIVEKEGVSYEFTPEDGQLKPFEYSKVRYAGYGYLAVSNDGVSWGIATLSGQLLTELKYDRIGMFRDYGTAKVQ